MRDYRLASTPANVTALTWSFLVYICMAIYAANLTANLTVSQASCCVLLLCAPTVPCPSPTALGASLFPQPHCYCRCVCPDAVQIKNDIRGIGDLPGKAVASWTGYLPALEKYNVAAKGCVTLV